MDSLDEYNLHLKNQDLLSYWGPVRGGVFSRRWGYQHKNLYAHVNNRLATSTL